MARGQAQAANTAIGNADLTATQAQKQGQQTFGQANQVFGMDLPAIQQQLNPTAATRNALTQLPQIAAGSAFDAAKENATRRMARTNNSAGYGELTDKLARDAASAQSDAALKGQVAVTDLQNKGIQNAGNLYGDVGKVFGMSEDTMAKLYGTIPGLLEGRAAGGSIYQGVDAFGNLLNSLKPAKS